MRKIILSILLLFFLFSCSESDEIEVLYRSGDYEAALERSNELLGNQLSENALYWKMLSSWALSMNDDASDAASLYLLLYPDEDDSHHLMVLRAVLFLDNNKAKAIEAGKELYSASLLGKAGASRHLGRRPKVRGVAMNPIDHPHGGGEGKTAAGRHPVTPWGKPTKGGKTRSKKKPSGRFIVKRRK